MPLRLLDRDAMIFNANDIQQAMARLSSAANEAKDELNEQDGKLGDGDLGITLANGWAEAVRQQLPEDDLGKAFLMISKSFQRACSSSFGTLVATGMMAAAKSTKGRAEANYAEISELLAAARDAMMARGKGELGQKSVLDVLDAVVSATAGLSNPGEMAAAAKQATGQTLDEFRDKLAGLGRARMYGESSKGLDDPGMLAFQRMLDGLLG